MDEMERCYYCKGQLKFEHIKVKCAVPHGAKDMEFYEDAWHWKCQQCELVTSRLEKANCIRCGKITAICLHYKQLLWYPLDAPMSLYTGQYGQYGEYFYTCLSCIQCQRCKKPLLSHHVRDDADGYWHEDCYEKTCKEGEENYKRITEKRCIKFGKALGFLDKLSKAISHSSCQ